MCEDQGNPTSRTFILLYLRILILLTHTHSSLVFCISNSLRFLIFISFSFSMAPKKQSSSQAPSSSSSQSKREKKVHLSRNPPLSYSSSEVKERMTKFSKRKIIPSRYMSKVGLDSLGCFEIVQTLLLHMGMFNFAFTPFITIPKLVIEFL